jgi:3-oxoacyl-[acyl-carrier protein] reductase
VTVAGLDIQPTDGWESLDSIALPIVADISKSAAVDAAVAEILSSHDRLDLVAHAAGIDDPAAKQAIADQLGRGGGALDVTSRLSDQSWRRMIDVNLNGAFYVLRAALTPMIAQRSGAIVGVGSDGAIDGVPGYAHYAAAKGGLHSLYRSVAREVAPHGVRINVVAPGVVETAMSERTPPEFEAWRVMAPVGRYAAATDVAEVIAFLLDQRSRHVVGETVLVTGGRLTV